MRYFLLPDTHLGHHGVMTKICNWPPDYENRILTTLMKMVCPGDVLIHLGDVALGWSLAEVQEFFGQVAGTKVLVKGNHDRHWSTTKWLNVFDAVFDAVVIKDVIFSHSPMFLEDKLNIHGHSHLGAEHGWYMPDACLLSLEELAYQPINLETVLYWRQRRWIENY